MDFRGPRLSASTARAAAQAGDPAEQLFAAPGRKSPRSPSAARRNVSRPAPILGSQRRRRTEEADDMGDPPGRVEFVEGFASGETIGVVAPRATVL